MTGMIRVCVWMARDVGVGVTGHVRVGVARGPGVVRRCIGDDSLCVAAAAAAVDVVAVTVEVALGAVGIGL